MCGNHRWARFVSLLAGILASGSQVLAATATVDPRMFPPAALPAAQCVEGAIAAEGRADRVDRDRLIEQALQVAPDFPPAHWQAGQIRYAGQWLTVDAALEKGADDRLLQDYRRLRTVCDKSPESQLKLARWCQKNNLSAETMVHASQVLAVWPANAEVLKMLDLTRHKGRLITAAELAQRKEQDQNAKQAMRRWRPLLTAIRGKIESKSAGERDEGMRELQAVHDPDAINALVAVFKNRPSVLCEAIRVIGQFPSQHATDVLLEQAVLAKSTDVLTAACDELKTRSMYGYVPKLISALSTPVETKFEVIRDNRAVHFRETLQREGGNAVITKTVDTNVTLLVPNPNLRNIIGEAYEATLLDIQKKEHAASILNRKLMKFNESIYQVLENTVGTVPARDPEEWWNWWREYTVTSAYEKPVYAVKYYNYVDVPYVPYVPAAPPRRHCTALLEERWFGRSVGKCQLRMCKSVTGSCHRIQCPANSPSNRSSKSPSGIKICLP